MQEIKKSNLSVWASLSLRSECGYEMAPSAPTAAAIRGKLAYVLRKDLTTSLKLMKRLNCCCRGHLLMSHTSFSPALSL